VMGVLPWGGVAGRKRAISKLLMVCAWPISYDPEMGKLAAPESAAASVQPRQSVPV